jgi:hypothetical protein
MLLSGLTPLLLREFLFSDIIQLGFRDGCQLSHGVLEVGEWRTGNRFGWRLHLFLLYTCFVSTGREQQRDEGHK